MTDLPTPLHRRIRLLAIGGSAREASRTRITMEAIVKLAPDDRFETTAVNLHDLDLPIYNDDLSLEQQPTRLQDLVEQVKAADAYLIVSPTYHGTMSGAIKNVLDALHAAKGQPDAFFQVRPVALAAFGGPSAINVVNGLQTVVRTMRGITVPTVVTVSAQALDTVDATIQDDAIAKRILTMFGDMAYLVAAQRALAALAAQTAQHAAVA